ncbi:MAG: DUF3782 domain-containing protein [candidate division WOR-3 bacterium]
MIEKINKILEKLPEEYRDSIREIVEIIIKEEIEQNRRMIQELWDIIKEGNRAHNERFEKLERILTELTERVNSLTQAVSELREVSKEHSERIEKLEKAVMELTQGIRELRQSVNELRQITKEQGERIDRLEKALIELTERVNNLTQAVSELTQAVNELRQITKEQGEKIMELKQAIKESNERMDKLEQNLKKYIDDKLSEFGSRWGIKTEKSFIGGIKNILEDIGYKVEKVEFYDDEGYVFSYPTTIEIDLLISNGKTYAIEIKSTLSEGDILLFGKKVDLYERKFKKVINRRIIITSFVRSKKVLEHAKKFKINVIKGVEKLKP